MVGDIDMLGLLMPYLVQLQVGSSDPEERRFLGKVAEFVWEVVDKGGDKAKVDTQEGIAGCVLDYGGNKEH